MVKREIVAKSFSYLADIPTLFQEKEVHTINLYMIGSRLSGKTLSVLMFIGALGFNNMALKCKTDFYRYEPKGAKESFNEAIAAYEDILGIDFNQKNKNSTDRVIKFPHNEISFKGFKSNVKKKVSKLGTARKGVKKKLQINIIDEITEFEEEKQVEMIKQATGGSNYVLNAYIANPWILSMWYVKKVNRMLPFNERTLMIHGEQFKCWVDYENNNLNIIHISNHRVNEFLSEAQHQALMDTKHTDHQLWRVADLGMPGLAEGLIYAPVMNKIKHTPKLKMPIEEFRGGIDLGTSTGPNGSATGMILGYFSSGYRNLVLEDGYYHSNSEQYYLSDDNIVKGLVDKIEEYVKANKRAILATRTGKLRLYYDHAALMFKTILQREINTRGGLKDYVKVAPCVKFEVPTRIRAVLDLINTSRFYMNKEKLAKLWEEMEQSAWDDTKLVKGLPTRQKIKDHLLDSLEYLIGSKIKKCLLQGNLTWDKRFKL